MKVLRSALRAGARRWGGRTGRSARAAALDRAMAHMPQGLCVFDAEGRLLAWNARYATIYGLAEGDLYAGMALETVVALRYARGAHPQMDQAEYLASRQKLHAHEGPSDTVVELSNGRIIAVHRRPMPSGGWLATHDDITHRSRNEAQVAYMARHDTLTGLPNRLLFRERLLGALAEAEAGRGVAVLCLDLDRFKSINDRLGHPVGDALLRAVADRLRDAVQEMDTVARLGGDEFAIIQVDATGPDAPAALAARIIEALRTPFLIEGRRVETGTSIGITLAPRDGVQPSRLVKNADQALYQAKSEGRGVYRFFTSAMDIALAERMALQSELQRSLQAQDTAEEFELHYQPRHDLVSGAVTGLEALLHWRHPVRGLLLPQDFMPVAEESGLVMPIGRWALRRACRDAVSWPGQPSVAVRLTPAQWRDPGLQEDVAEALAVSGLAPERLELEIQEAAMLQDEDGSELLEKLQHFRAWGIRIVLDGFGAGTSSLACLRRFAFARVKIDASFARDVGISPQATAILRAIAEMARTLGIATTVEGVENAGQFKALVQAGCDDIQGGLFSPPVPAGALPEVLGRNESGAMRRVIRLHTAETLSPATGSPALPLPEPV